MTVTTYMTLDARKRLNLASLNPRSGYRVTVEDDGRILLEPAVVLSEVELAELRGDVGLAALVEAAEMGGRRVEPVGD